MKLVNLTPHDIVIRALDNSSAESVMLPGDLLIPASGQTARLQQTTAPAGVIEIDGRQYLLEQSQFGSIVGLPEPEPDVLYIVSLPVAQTARRRDVVAPNTGTGAIRLANGQPFAVRSLIFFSSEEDQEPQGGGQ